MSPPSPLVAAYARLPLLLDMESNEFPSPKVVAEAAIAELRALVTAHDPIELLARVATHISVGDPDQPTDAGGPTKSEVNLEYLLSVVTTGPFPVNPEFLAPEVIQRTVDLLTLIHFAAAHHLMSAPISSTPAEAALSDIAASFQADKLHVRGDAYWPHLQKTTLDLLRPHDEKLRELLGFTSTDYFVFFARFEAELNARIETEYKTWIRPFIERIDPWMHKDKKGKYVPKDSEAYARFWKDNADELKVARDRFDRAHGPELYLATAENDAERHILASLSTEFGENTEFLGRKPEHAFWPLTDSCTDRRPVIHYAGNHYIFHPNRPQRDAYTIIGDLVRTADPKYWERKFLRTRDDYLEAETARLFSRALPDVPILTSVTYPLSGGGVSEADIVVLCDDVLLIVECKATRLDPATKRGADRKISADLKATIVGGLNQAERFVNELVSRGTMTVVDEKTKDSTTLSAARFRHLMRVNITLELINVVATQLWQLEAVGLTSEIDRAWSVSLNDLRVIVEILDQPAVFLHFLLRRLDLNEIQKIHARDEIDYMMHYVRQGLFFREANAPNENEDIRLVGFTEDLDQYYRRVQGLTEKGDKPQVNLGSLTQPVITALETQRPPHWMTGCLALLEFDTPEREALLAKRTAHREMAERRDMAFAYSLTANFESRQGVIIASASNPALAAPMLQARVLKRIREYELDEIVILLGGVHQWDSEVHVIIVNTKTTVDEITARLVSQLVIQSTEERKSRILPSPEV